jgi:hypothetical protein
MTAEPAAMTAREIAERLHANLSRRREYTDEWHISEIEQAIRESRYAALREAAQIADDRVTPEPVTHYGSGYAAAATNIASQIRAHLPPSATTGEMKT